MNRTPRNQSLLAQLSEHNPFRAELVHRLFAIGNGFEQAIAAVGADGRLSAQGKREKAQSLVAKARADLDAAQQPVHAYRRETESLRSGMKSPAAVHDKSDISAALLRREFRDRAASMNFGQRAALMSGPTRDTNFIDALLEQPAWVSGIDLRNPNEAEQYEEAKQSRLRDLNGELMTALEARASVEAEIAMVIDIVRIDLESDATDLARAA
jgi:hypothetical protein